MPSNPQSAIRNPRSSLLRGGLEKSFDLCFVQKPEVAGLQSFVFQEPDSHAAELDNRMADVIEHLSDLLISALVERDPVPCVRGALLHQAYHRRRGPFAVYGHAAF